MRHCSRQIQPFALFAVATLSSSAERISAAVFASACLNSGTCTDDCVPICATPPGVEATWDAWPMLVVRNLIRVSGRAKWGPFVRTVAAQCQAASNLALLSAIHFSMSSLV